MVFFSLIQIAVMLELTICTVVAIYFAIIELFATVKPIVYNQKKKKPKSLEQGNVTWFELLKNEQPRLLTITQSYH